MDPKDLHRGITPGWLRDLDKARKERQRLDRLNSLRRGSTKPLPKWAAAPNR